MLDLIDAWREQRPSTEFFVIARSPEGHLQPELASRAIPVMTIPYGSWVLPKRITAPEDVFRTSREDFAAVRAIERFIETWGPDLVITNTIVSPWAAVAAKLVGARHVWFAHEFGDDHEFQLTREQTFTDIGLLSDLVVASSRALRDHLEQWVVPHKLAVLYGRMDVGAIKELGMQRMEGDAPFTEAADLRIVCVARISRSKGQARLARAVAELATDGIRAEVALVGTPGEAAARELRAELTSLGVDDRVFLMGERSNPHPIIRAADIGAVVSDSEGFGRATVEYMAAGKPVVGYRAGATLELVEHGTTGMLVDRADQGSLAAALAQYARDRSLLERHGSAAMRMVEQDISLRHGVEELLERLDAVVSGPPSGMPRLPALLASWLELPEVSLQYLTDAGATIDLRNTVAWRLGRLITGAPGRVKSTLFRLGAAR